MPKNILAVDDEPHMLTLLERIVTEKTPFSITTTSNSLEVPALLDADQYDLIISDLKMPGMDGLDILRYLREQGRSELVVIITAFGSLDTASEALSLGVFDYIVKPFRKEQIILTLERAMKFQQCRRESTSMTRLFEIEPFAQAADAFKAEYVRRLAGRVGKDRDELLKRSGLTAEHIAEVLKDFES